jgi:glucose-1-phosphate cytidylyltransferase
VILELVGPALNPRHRSPLLAVSKRPVVGGLRDARYLDVYAAHGFDEIVAALGYGSYFVKEYFLNFFTLNNDIIIDPATGITEIHEGRQTRWEIDIVGTGVDTMPGGRLHRGGEWFGDQTFMMTHGDDVADIDVGVLAAFHRGHGNFATVTAVRPPPDSAGWFSTATATESQVYGS